VTLADVTALLPLIVVSAAVVVVLVVVTLRRSHILTLLLTLAGLILAFVALAGAYSTSPRSVTPLLVVDNYALFYTGLLLAATFAVAVLAYGYLERQEGRREEFYVLLLLATLGTVVLASSNHFASFFLGLEILSVGLYALVAYRRTAEHSIEGGFKYLVLAGTSAAFLLFGMALIYADQGTMVFNEMSLQPVDGRVSVFLGAGMALVLIGIAFKLALAPFHMWAPDVYQGSPAPATAFLATVSKGSIVALLLRLFGPASIQDNGPLFAALSVVAIASMFGGNLLALIQDNLKRILAYSSIAHLGYLLVAFLAGGAQASVTATFYLVTYFLPVLIAFGVIGVLSSSTEDTDMIGDYRGLLWRRPGLAGVLTAALLSLASMPLTAGFVGKVYILITSVRSTLWLLSISLVVSSVIGLYYYLRVIVAMYRQPSLDEEKGLATPKLSLEGGLVLAALTLVLVGLGVYPPPLIRLIETVVAGLAQ
jgi:NADH-quinone oxidoreductase subunit N